MPKSKGLKILFLTARFIYPVIGGDRLKPYNILSHLAKDHDVTLVSFYQGNEPPRAYIREVESLGVKLHYIPLNPISAGVKTLLELPKKYPLEISYYLQKDYKKKVKKLQAENIFDLGFAFFMRTAEYIKNMPFKKILMAEDCRTLYQKRSSQESSDLKQKIVRLWEYKKLKYYEPRIVEKFDTVTLVTNEDIASMQQQNPNPRYRLLTNGVDIDSFKPAEDAQRSGILFAGKLDVWANVLMLQNIVREIMPKILNEVPDARLDIVGAKPAQEVKALAENNDFVTLTADVPDMHPYLQNAALFLHPHSGGSGIQNKLLEAMACGCPVVTSPTGNQGIYARHGIEAMIGDSADEFAEHTVKILTDKELADTLSVKGRNLIVRTHSWESVFEATDEIIDEVMND